MTYPDPAVIAAVAEAFIPCGSISAIHISGAERRLAADGDRP